MPLLDRSRSLLLLIDFQERLMPVIDQSGAVIANAVRLLKAARLLDVPALRTEQNPRGLGPTLPELAGNEMVVEKVSFAACPATGFAEALGNREQIVLSGCEAHICVAQTALGLRAQGREVFVVRDAVGSRRAESKETALVRLAANGVEIVTTEMVLFEWLATSADPQFKAVSALIR
ncbi:isochorismatase family protein [Rhodoligotrophos defluvii]|uniref:isochorismatase family protein n=1 Tax=Rhodoligotrophos defluvii TaxID=2561934 RepID=UPI0010C9AAF3|nr:isochorismatase family protein [Rhodoligotrophos defluvii]